jgi:hypothetical protein
LDENKYEIKQTLDFNECFEYKSSIDFTINTNIDELDENKEEQFKMIKLIIYNEGPLLAALNSKLIFIILFFYLITNKKSYLI